jgi:hypothetical protein
MSPPNGKRRLCGTALRKLRLLGAYHANTLFATMLGAAFWFFEQRRGQLADSLDNQRGAQ